MKPVFKVGDRVEWTSQAAGTERTKVGEVIEVVAAGRAPKTYAALPRDHESYVVRAVAQGRTTQKSAVYWPRVSALRRSGPKVHVEGASLTICSYSIEVSDGTTTRRWAGDTLEGFQRDLALADAGKAR